MVREISISRIVSDTGIPRTSIYRTLTSLKEKRLIYVVTNKDGVEKIGVNLRYDTWNVGKYGRKRRISEVEQNFTEDEISCTESGD
jgi:DNA-binding transcriptional ArsR family regulator